MWPPNQLLANSVRLSSHFTLLWSDLPCIKRMPRDTVKQDKKPKNNFWFPLCYRFQTCSYILRGSFFTVLPFENDGYYKITFTNFYKLWF
jgi:hypothetical protein